MSTELALTDREKRRLKTLEDGIRNSGKMMYESMRAIHDEKLYRDEFDTWERYAAERWGMSAQWARRIIEHGKILGLLNDDDPKMETIVSISEAATRPLNRLTDERKVQVIKDVAAKTEPNKAGKKQIKAAAVKAAVSEIEKTNGHARSNGKTKPRGREVSPAKLVDGLVRTHVSPLVRGVDSVAEVNGGRGEFHTQASAALDTLIASLREMREGKQ